MKKVIVAVALMVLAGAAMAQVSVGRQEFGSGTPGSTGTEGAVQWDGSNIYHAPQYMPGYPTAATIFPRVVNLDCVKSATGLVCNGYNWLPELGRGEYLMFRPVVREAAKPVVVTKEVIKEVPVVVIKEVPVTKKKIGE
jgi:hypothetical protein